MKPPLCPNRSCPSRLRHFIGVTCVWVVALVGCETTDDGDGQPLDALLPPVEEVQPGPVCDYRELGQAGVVGHLWTYVDGRPVLHRSGSGGVKRFQERWDYDTRGRMVEYQLDGDGDGIWDQTERWTFDGDHLVGYEQDGIDRDQLPDEVWQWTWDDQGQLVVRQADFTGDGQPDYREQTSWPAPDREVTTFDMDGDGDEDIRFERVLNNIGADFFVEANRTGQYGNLGPRSEYRGELGQRLTRYSGANRQPDFQASIGVQRLEGRTIVRGGRHETCYIDDEDGRVIELQVDDDGILGSGTVTYEARSQPIAADLLERDALGNVIGAPDRRDFHYDPSLENLDCGQGVPLPPMYPWPVVLDDDYFGLDPLCEPEYLDCRFATAPWRMPRC